MQNIEKSDDRGAASNGVRCCSSSAWWQLPVLLAIVLVGVLLVNGRGDRHQQLGGNAKSIVPPARGEAGPTVALEIRIERSNSVSANAISWHEGMTVRDLLTAAETTDPFKIIKFSQQRTGELAFLTDLAGVANEGAGGRNWMYEVNGKSADRSFAVYELHPGDRVLWKFEAMQ